MLSKFPASVNNIHAAPCLETQCHPRTLVRRCVNVIQMFCVYWEPVLISGFNQSRPNITSAPIRLRNNIVGQGRSACPVSASVTRPRVYQILDLDCPILTLTDEGWPTRKKFVSG